MDDPVNIMVLTRRTFPAQATTVSTCAPNLALFTLCVSFKSFQTKKKVRPVEEKS
jgi:hypothetical protein